MKSKYRRIAHITVILSPIRTIKHSFSKDFKGSCRIEDGCLIVDTRDCEDDFVRVEGYKNWTDFDVHYVDD